MEKLGLTKVDTSTTNSVSTGFPSAVDSLVALEPERPRPTLQLLEFVIAACGEIGSACDQTELRRQLHIVDYPAPVQLLEAARGQLFQSAPFWSASVNFLDLTVAEAVRLLRPRAPIGLVWLNESQQLSWILVCEQRGNKIRVFRSDNPTKSEWMSVKKLRGAIGVMPDDRCRWLAVQPQLPCEDVRNRHHSISPYARFLSLIAPDRGDIAVIIIFAVFIGLLALSTPLAVETLVNTVAFGQFVQPVIVLSLMLFVFLAFAAAMRATQAYVAEILQRRIFARIAADLYNRLPRVKPAFWRTHYGPELVNRFFEVVTVQKVLTQLLLDGTVLALQAIVGMAVIAFYHPLFIGFDIFLLLLIVAIIFLLGRGAIATSIEESRHKYATAAWLEELARHPLAFRSERAIRFALEQGDGRVCDYLQAREKHFHVLLRQMIATLALQVIASTLLLGLGGWLVIRGELTLGQLVAAELIVTVIVGSFGKISKYLESYYDVMASVDKLGHLFDMPIELCDGIALPRQGQGISVSLQELTKHTAVHRRPLYIKNLVLQPGDHVAIIKNPSGLHSELLRVVAGVDLPDEGHVDLDGYDIRRLRPDTIHDQVAMVSALEIFEGTIAENLHMGDERVTEKEICEALEMVGLLESIRYLPDGLAARLDTAGSIFTQDQLVQFMLARAIVSRPRLLLIDGWLDVLADDLLGEIAERMLRALSSTTILITTGRESLIEKLPMRFCLTTEGQLQTVYNSQRRVAANAPGART